MDCCLYSNLNKKIKTATGWNMKVDLTKNQNIEILKLLMNTCEPFHTIPFRRRVEWTQDDFTEFETHTPMEILENCTHFTITGDGEIADSTDTRSEYKLKIVNPDGVTTFIDCAACTGLEHKIYNQITIPIQDQARVTLLCKPYASPVQLMPCDRYEVDFCISDAELKEYKLIDPANGLINKELLPKSTDNFPYITLTEVTTDMTTESDKGELFYIKAECNNPELMKNPMITLQVSNQSWSTMALTQVGENDYSFEFPWKKYSGYANMTAAYTLSWRDIRGMSYEGFETIEKPIIIL